MAFEPQSQPGAPPDSPYEIELVSASGTTLPTYEHAGRFYVLGQVGQRYGIRVRNPTAERVEAVISVDGLDVIDGETAAVTKRGYLVAPYSDIVIPGFRVSEQQVAAFRFSSVSNSYAGRKGKARNVGVIGVALFNEQASAPMVLPEQSVAKRDYRYRAPTTSKNLDEDDSVSGSADGEASGAPANDRIAPAEPSHARRIRPQPRPDYEPPPCCGEPRRETRPGLGTEFGERRHSAVRFTRFVRANPTRPIAYAELRYNDRDGLAALGVLTDRPAVDPDELTRRETAEPFPGFAQPPR